MTSKVDRRRQEIRNVLQVDGIAYVTETAKLFDVTTETIRNDFDVLATEQGVTRFHGGLRRDKTVSADRHYRYKDKKSLFVETKRRLCRGAAELVKDGEHIYLDGGSTVSYLPSFLSLHSDLVLVTPSMAVMSAYLADGFADEFDRNGNRLVVAGGTVHAGMLTTHGAIFEESVQNLRFDKAFFSVDAIDLDFGCSNSDEITFAVMRTVADRAAERILLADSSKFGRVANYRVATWDRIDYLVTDASLGTDWTETLRGHAVACIQV